MTYITQIFIETIYFEQNTFITNNQLTTDLTKQIRRKK